MADNVKVAVRVRPFNQREKDRSSTLIISMDGKATRIKNPEDGTERTFAFDHSYNSFVPRDDPEYASQTTVWSDLGVGILANAFEGYNCSLFAYGQTGSGKSYSMMGYGPDRGIIPIASEHIFDRMHENRDPDLQIKVTCSMLEIYMEKTRDLFNMGQGELKIRNDPKRGFFVEGLTQNAVGDYESIAKLMDAGSKARTVASTAMNATSSRAHTIFQIILTQTKIDRAAGTAKDKVAVINLIDLAGSERADSTGATGDRLKEGAAINLSLTCLGNVISALAANSDPAMKKKQRVPYRDSVLTMLLQNSLGGNAKTIMIAALSPADINYDETLSTLRYADRAKQIKNKAIVNEDPNEKLIKGLRDEIDQLRRALAAAATGGVMPAGLGGVDTEAERQRIRAEEMARMREELESKLKMEMEESKTWDERLEETKRRAQQREAELRELGVVTGAEREALLEKAKTEPHMTNLHEDSQLSEQVLFFLDLDREVTVGRKDAPTPKDVKLGGLGILPDHASIIRHSDGIFLHAATEGAKIHVNGDLVTSPVQLHHFSRIVFGTGHVYKVIVPAEAAAGRKPDGDDVPDVIDYAFSINEINKAQVRAIAAQEAARRAEAEEERRKANARVAELEARMLVEREAAEREALEKIRAYEERARELAGNEEMVRKLKEEQERMEKEARAKQDELERKLQAQIEETESIRRKREKESREKSLLDEKLLKTIPLVNEANAISEELGKRMAFEPKLMANQHKIPMAELRAMYGEEATIPEQLDTEVYVRVEFTGGTQPPALWVYEKFMNRLYIMREMYQTWSENGKSLEGTDFTNPERDPFFDPPEDQLIGKVSLYLESLQFLLPIEEKSPIIDYKGAEQGELSLRIIPHSGDQPPKSAIEQGAEDDIEDLGENMQELKGKRLGITVCVDAARGLPAMFSMGTFVKYRFFLEAEATKTPASTKKTINPQFKHTNTFTPVVTDDFMKFVRSEPLEVEVWGRAAVTAGATGSAPSSRPPTAGTPSAASGAASSFSASASAATRGAAIAGGSTQESEPASTPKASAAAAAAPDVAAQEAAAEAERVRAAQAAHDAAERDAAALKAKEAAEVEAHQAAARAAAEREAQAAAAAQARAAAERAAADQAAAAERERMEREIRERVEREVRERLEREAAAAAAAAPAPAVAAPAPAAPPPAAASEPAPAPPPAAAPSPAPAVTPAAATAPQQQKSKACVIQ